MPGTTRRPKKRPTTINMVPNPAEQRFVAEYMATGNASAAGRAIDRNPAAAQRLARTPRILSAIHRAMADAGIDDNAIAERLRAAMFAKKPLFLPTAEGAELQWIDDHPTQLQAIKLLLDVSSRTARVPQRDVDEIDDIPDDLSALSSAEIVALIRQRQR